MADWSHETRRFIYRTPDPKWMALPASTRAFAAELLRWVDDDGAVYLRPSEEPWEAVARVMQAGRPDLPWVKRSLLQLLGEDASFPDERHLEIVAGDRPRVRIRNFKIAQGIVETADEISTRRAKEADKKARQRAAKRAAAEGHDPPLSGAVPHNVPPNVPPDVPGDIPRDSGVVSLGDTRAGAHAQVRAPARACMHASAPASRAPAPSVPVRSGPCPVSIVRPIEDVLRHELGEKAAFAGDLAQLARQLARKSSPIEVVTEAARQVAEAADVRKIAAVVHSKVTDLMQPGGLDAALDARFPERVQARRLAADQERLAAERLEREAKHAADEKEAFADFAANRLEGEDRAAYRRRLADEARASFPQPPPFARALDLAKTGTER